MAPTCFCGTPLPETATRRRVYCSTRCRVAAARRRRAIARACSEIKTAGDAWPIAVADHAPPARALHPDEQVARAVLELGNVGGAFGRLAVEARPALAWRCEKVAGAIAEALGEWFPVAR